MPNYLDKKTVPTVAVCPELTITITDKVRRRAFCQIACVRRTLLKVAPEGKMRRNRGGECLPQRHKFLRKFVYFTGARRCWTKMGGVAEFAGPRRFGSETWPRPGSGVVSPG